MNEQSTQPAECCHWSLPSLQTASVLSSCLVRPLHRGRAPRLRWQPALVQAAQKARELTHMRTLWEYLRFPGPQLVILSTS